jgi:hypothetical protein
MGGNAFPKLGLSRIQRDQIKPTIIRIVGCLSIPGFDVDYALDNLMGSAGKQDTSGDLDFAINNKSAHLVGQPNLPVFDIRKFAARCREVLPNTHINTKPMNSGQFNTAWPIVGSEGLIQADFITGDPEWLKFSHWSPGLDYSPNRGVMISTLFGVLTKMNLDFLKIENDEILARVCGRYDIEKGFYRKWEIRSKSGNLAVVSPDEFETKIPDAPRFSRLGYICHPEVVLRILFQKSITVSQVDTFEKAWLLAKERYQERIQELEDRFVETSMRSTAFRYMTEMDLRNACK